MAIYVFTLVYKQSSFSWISSVFNVIVCSVWMIHFISRSIKVLSGIQGDFITKDSLICTTLHSIMVCTYTQHIPMKFTGSSINRMHFSQNLVEERLHNTSHVSQFVNQCIFCSGLKWGYLIGHSVIFTIGMR